MTRYDILTAVPTAFHRDGSLDLEGSRAIFRFVVTVKPTSNACRSMARAPVQSWAASRSVLASSSLRHRKRTESPGSVSVLT